MRKVLQLNISGAKPVRHGMDYLWSLILDLTRESDVFSYGDVIGRYDPAHRTRVSKDLAKLVSCGFLERLTADGPSSARPYRLLKRQTDTPVLRTDGRGPSTAGLGLQNMWNVMRRARNGFTVSDLAIEASTDDCAVSYENAYSYCRVLHRAGVLKMLPAGKGSTGRMVYVLLGSGNTGPKPPRRYRSTFVFDENKGCVLGRVDAEEVSP
ncbi:hypothetical protein [Shinella sp. BYT-45]|uniref:hypothetical protein n=1 Tax=Shinella sp. BYT-45 TaxID=3377377 RepID=UPI00397EACC9